jgi:hypothetical protein
MADAAAQAAAQQAANRRLNETISDLPKFYGTSKDTISAENLIDRVDSSVHALGWTPAMAFEFFRMALHSDAEEWIKCIRETSINYEATWDFIKPLFKARFGKKMDVAKCNTILENIKQQPDEHPVKFAARLNSAFSQLRELIPKGTIFNLPANAADRTDEVCERIHHDAIRHTHLQYLKYFFIAGLKSTLMQPVATKDPATFTEAYDEASRVYELTKKNGNGTHAISEEEKDDNSINQIRGNGSQNPYRGNYRGGRGNRGRGAPRGGPTRGGFNNGYPRPSGGDNQTQNQNKPTCWFCGILGHRQDDCRKRIKENKPCVGPNGTTYWPKPKQMVINEEPDNVQGAIGEDQMYTGQLSQVFSGFH